MRISDLLSEQQLDELSFMGSQCTKDCSGHRAGYKWSLDRGGVENPASPSQSFINGSNIGARQMQKNKQQRTQGGGKISGYQSQTANAVRKRQARAQAKVDQGMHGSPLDESTWGNHTRDSIQKQQDWRDTERNSAHSFNTQGFTVVFDEGETKYFYGGELVASRPRKPGPITNHTVSIAKSQVIKLLQAMRSRD